MHDGVLPPRSRSFSAMEYPMKKLSKKSLALKSTGQAASPKFCRPRRACR